MAVRVEPADVLLWTLMAFALWLMLGFVFARLRLPGAPVVAAVLSWLMARAAIWSLPLLLHWITGYGPPWR
jgi:hypothetical protein